MTIRNYDIGGMLARSGQSIGQRISQGVENFGEGIGGLITGVGTGVVENIDRRAKEKTAQEVQQLLQQNAKNPAQLNSLGQKYASEGKNDMAKLFFDAAKTATGKVEGRGKGELMALANNPKFNVFDQKQQSGYLGMAEAFDVSREEAMEIALKAVEAREGKTGDDDYRKSDEVIIRDSKGNKFTQYSIQDINNPAATPVIKYVPIGDAPDKPVGDVTIISQRTGAGAFDKPGIAGDVRAEQEFADLKVEATAQLPELMSQSRILDDAVAALETMESQGLPEVVVNTIRSEFGVQDPDIAEYEMLVGELMFSRLKPLFGGVISEGEREAIVGLYNDMKRGGPANRRILMQLQKKVKETIVKANLMRRADSFDDYNMSLDRMYPTEEEKTEQNVVDYNDLPTQG